MWQAENSNVSPWPAVYCPPMMFFSIKNFWRSNVKALGNPSIEDIGMCKAARLLLVAVLVMLCIPLNARAQDTGYISGTLTDKTGSAVVAADVTVENLAGSITRTTTSNGDGVYVVAGLPGDIYNITATAKGFQKFQAQKVVLPVAQKIRVDIQLTLGAMSEQVIVTGESVAQVETQSSDLSTAITGKQISQLQLNGRNFTQLVNLTTGVVDQTNTDEGKVGVYGNVNYSMNGGRNEYNNWELDGGDNMDNGSNGTLNVYPSLEAIAEFKVLTSNYGAQYGRNGSGTVEVETKSGTRSFHGDAYEFVRNDIFNANTFPQSRVPPYKKNDFGYTVGGLVFIPGLYNKDRSKTFVFWSQEWRKERVPANLGSVTVPSLAERGGDFSDLCPDPLGSFSNCPTDPNTHAPFPGNIVPIDTVNSPALAAEIPEPTQGVNTWNASPTLPTTWREELIRVDHNFTDKVSGTFRYIHDSWNQLYPTPLWTNGTSFPTIQTNFGGPGVSMVARLTATLSPTLLNEFVASYTTDHITLIPVGAWQRPASMTFGLFPGADQGKVPGINLGGGIYNFGEDVGYLPNGPYNSNPTYTYRENVNKIIGKHNLQFGAYIVAAQKNELSAPG